MNKKKNKSKYRVVLISKINGDITPIYKKTLYRCSTKENAFIKYHKIKENNKVFFPKKHINTKQIKTVKYFICVTKIHEEQDIFRQLRDDYGKIYTEDKFGDWTILASEEFLIEETFWMYGFNAKSNRPTIKEIAKKIFTGAYTKNMIKQVIVVNNKLVVYNENQFDMVLCKNIEDAQRLHHSLAKIAKKQKIKNLLFVGTAINVGPMYKLIMDRTGWNYSKTKRLSTKT